MHESKGEKRNAIIFGGSGFIGNHLIKYLTNELNMHCINLDIKQCNSNNNDLIYEYCDVRKEININSTINNSDIIFNLAAVHTTPGHNKEEYYTTNVLGAKHICDFANENKIETIIFFSSISVYGTTEKIMNEESILMPDTYYGMSKLIAENINIIWQERKSKIRELIILRPGIVFGKGENGNFTRITNLIESGLYFFPGRSTTNKSMIYVKDLVSLSYNILQDRKRKTRFKIYNMCYPSPNKLKTIFNTIAELKNNKAIGIILPSWIILLAANIINKVGKLFKLNSIGIHPDRVKKLMNSTNISGEKLQSHGFKLRYSFKEALFDWYSD